jgi:hypothetical protein
LGDLLKRLTPRYAATALARSSREWMRSPHSRH